MAYLWDPTKDPNQQNPMGAGAPPPTPTGTSGTGTQGTSGTAKPTGSGQFTNLQSYIRANENTDAGKQVGSGVLGAPDKSVAESANQVGKLTSMTPGAGPAAMDKADEDFLTNVGTQAPAASPTPKPGADTVAPPGSGPFGNTGGIAGSAGVQQAGQAQVDTAAQDKQRYEDLFKKYGAGPGSYSGTTQQDVSNQVAAAQNAQTLAAQQANVLQGANTSGRSELLKSQYGKDRQYSGGENKLDSFLLERNYGNQFDPKFQAVKGQLTAQENAGKAAETDLNSKIADTQKAYTDTTEKWRALLSGAAGRIGVDSQLGQDKLNSSAIQLDKADQYAAAGDAEAQAFKDKIAGMQNEYADQAMAGGNTDILGLGDQINPEAAKMSAEIEARRRKLQQELG